MNRSYKLLSLLLISLGVVYFLVPSEKKETKEKWSLTHAQIVPLKSQPKIKYIPNPIIDTLTKEREVLGYNIDLSGLRWNAQDIAFLLKI